MKSKRRIVIYIVCVIAFVVLLVCSNAIMESLFAAKIQTSPVKKIVFHEEDFKRDGAVCNIDVFTYLNDMSERVEMEGWAFCDTVQNNADRQLFLVLDGPGTKDYIIEFDRFRTRADVQEAFPGRSVRGDVGFVGSFSTVNIPNGTYDMYIYCWENDVNYGIAYTGSQAIKTNHGMTKVSWTATQVVPPVQITEETQSRFAIDSVTFAEQRLQITGWALVPGYSAQSQSVYISMTDEDGEALQYTAKSNSRPDVADAFGEPAYENSGYQASIPADEISDGTWSLRILVENEGKVWASAPATLIKSGDTVELKK